VLQALHYIIINCIVDYLNKGYEISGSHGGEYEDRAFWDVAPCSLVGVDRRFIGVYCPDDGGSTLL
jgi:hypothetical protein